MNIMLIKKSLSSIPGKLIYCTRTVPEMQQCATELKRVMKYRSDYVKEHGGNTYLP